MTKSYNVKWEEMWSVSTLHQFNCIACHFDFVSYTSNASNCGKWPQNSDANKDISIQAVVLPKRTKIIFTLGFHYLWNLTTDNG